MCKKKIEGEQRPRGIVCDVFSSLPTLKLNLHCFFSLVTQASAFVSRGLSVHSSTSSILADQLVLGVVPRIAVVEAQATNLDKSYTLLLRKRLRIDVHFFRVRFVQIDWYLSPPHTRAPRVYTSLYFHPPPFPVSLLELQQQKAERDISRPTVLRRCLRYSAAKIATYIPRING